MPLAASGNTAMTKTTAQSTAMIWPTTLAGVLGAAILGVAVLAVPADAGSSQPTTTQSIVDAR